MRLTHGDAFTFKKQERKLAQYRISFSLEEEEEGEPAEQQVNIAFQNILIGFVQIKVCAPISNSYFASLTRIYTSYDKKSRRFRTLPPISSLRVTGSPYLLFKRR